MTGSDERFFDREALLARPARPRRGNLLFLLESWPGATEAGVLEFLGSIDLFAGLAVEELRDLLGTLEAVPLAAGETLIREGELADFLGIVGRGRLRVGALAAERGPGDVVGESALLASHPAPATVLAVRDSLVLRLSAVSFERFGERHPRVLLHLCRQLIRPAPVAPPASRSITVVPLVPGADVGPDLVAALSPFGRATHVTAADADRALGDGASEWSLDDPRSGSVVEWLERLEADHGFLVYDAGTTRGGWWHRAIRQADLVLLVAPERASLADVAPVDSFARRELVLLHDSWTSRPQRTDRWLDRVPVAAHHHVRRNSAADIGRLARGVAGRAVAVVLSGGGARGAAHLGVLRAMEEAAIPIDAIGGTSIGALVGSFYAQGCDHETRVAKVLGGFRRSEVLRPTLPLISLSSSAATSRRLAFELEGARIEDLWTPFFCVSANISRAELVVHDRGDTWRAVRASISLPGIFPPVFHNGDLLVDGGVLNNLPIDVMEQRMAGARILAVELFRPVDLRVEKPFEPSVSGWRVLGRKLGIPSPATIMLRAAELQSARRHREVLRGAYAVLRPPVEGYGLLDFDTVRPLVDSAYRWACDELERSGLKDRLLGPPV